MNLIFKAAAAFLFTVGIAQAAPVNFADMTLNGNAALDGTSLELTQSANSQRGSAFTDAVAVNAGTTFSAAFEFDIFDNGNGGADGLVFVVQNNVNGANALGGNGFGLGYQGITNSIGVELDTWSNGGIDNSSANHVGINEDGSVDSVALAEAPFDLQTEGNPGFVWVEYDGSVLEVFISDTNSQPGTAILSTAFDITSLGDEVHFGFTASTGGARAVHAINSFDLDVKSAVAAVPLPAGLPLLGVGLLAFGWMRRRA